MKVFRLLALLSVLFATQANAAIETLSFNAAQTGVSALALTAPRTFTLPIAGYNQVTIYVAYTFGTATAVNMSCQGAWDQAATVKGDMVMVTVGTGTITASDPTTWTYPVTQSTVLRFQILPINDASLSCTLTGTGAGSGDIVSVYARAGVI